MTILVPIAPPAFDVVIDLRYATADNITGAPLYKRPACFLHPKAADALHEAIHLASRHQLKFKIFDAFRPKEIQQRLWDHTPDPQFLSNPETGACPHCRGVAVDLTLIDTAGMELDMGTAFDQFSPRSHHGNTDIPVAAQKNRLLLMDIMMKAGWDFYRNEWWHYQLFHCREYALLDDAGAGTKLL